MQEPVSLTALFDAAEQAAMSGDYPAAARLLTDAARAQEAALGPDHRDLANTLNNLAVAHERSGDLDAAEREFRRAYAIASRSLAPDDPLVATSAQNLRDFCLVNGRSIDGVTPPSQAHVFDWPPAEGGRHSTTVERYEVPAASDLVVMAPAGPVPAGPVPAGPAPSTPAAAAPLSSPATAPTPAPAPVAPEPARPNPPPRPAPSAAPVPQPAPASTPTTGAPARRVPGWLVGLAVVVLAGVIWLLVGRRSEPARPAPAEPVMDPVPPPAQAPSPNTAPAPPPGSRGSTKPSPGATAPPSPAAPASPGRAGDVTVGEARLCTALVAYRCTAAASPVRPGQITFYTRLVATRDTTVIHRWYRSGQLRQAVRLSVPARAAGFRTYSRSNVYDTGAEWRVELRTVDGTLLHSETFQVK